MKKDRNPNLRPQESGVASRRRTLNLQQADLAARVGVSRQFLSMIESGRAQPNVQVALRLAAELRCSVEDIFVSAETSDARRFSVQLADTGLAAGVRLDLAKIEDRWVGYGSDSPDTLGGGFAESDAVLARVKGKAEARPHRTRRELERNIAIAGCDPALGLLCGRDGLTAASHGIGLSGRCLWFNCGSSRALGLLAEGLVHAAGLHYTGLDSDENLRQVRRFDSAGNWQIFRFTRWESGWMVRNTSRRRFKGIGDLSEPQFRLANREQGSGSRHWLDAELSRAHLRSSDIPGYADELLSHWQCARALREGRADIAVGPRAIAEAFGLDFVSTGEVSFDLVVPKIHLDHPGLQAVLQRVRSRAFQREVETLAGYDAHDAGTQIG